MASQRRSVVDKIAVASPRGTLAVASVLVGLVSPFITLSGENATTIVFFRFGLAFLALLPMVVHEWRQYGPMRRADLLLYAVCGVCFGVDMALWTPSVLLAGPSVSAVVVNYVQALAVPLVAWLFFRNRVPWMFFVAAPFSLGGIFLLSGILDGAGGSDLVRGIILSALAGLTYTVYVVLTGRTNSPHHQGTAMAIVCLVTTVVSTPLLIATHGPLTLALSASSWGWMILIALSSQVLGWLFCQASMPLVNPSVAATLILIQPLSAIVFSAVLVGERLSALQWLGAIIMLLGIFLIGRAPKRRYRLGIKRPSLRIRRRPVA